MKSENKINIKKQMLSLVFPTRCPVCDEIVVPLSEQICLGCMDKLKLLTPPWCMRCGKKLNTDEEFCEDCKKKVHYFTRGRALYEYQSVASAIYRMKYGGRREYAEFFGKEMAVYLKDFIAQVKPDGIVPIPLHRRRLNKRGYNQAALLAKALGACTGIPVYERIVRRMKNTAPLKLQNPEERQNNLKKAFIMLENDVKLKTILLVDDIYTTGSTINEVTKVLKQGGVLNVYFVTLACGAGV
uniref:double zinc ribbon domain-containing protein n=1 Tax=Acetatifactor sp. TaxID=1872090 RepID=UPI004055EC39